jgi:cyclophilin family peptidyl-prolyl cis-trans isomerase/HEAT repeat protein
VGALLFAPATARGQFRADAASVQAVRQAIFDAEDRRAPNESDLKTLLEGTRHPAEAVQRQAIRALGRLERPALAGEIEPALSSTFASVRAAAAEALGQAAATGGGDVAAAVQAVLLKRLRAERDQSVIGAICWTLGRLPYSTAQAARSAEVTLLVAALQVDASPSAPLTLQLGVARGFEALLRRSAKLFTPSQATTRRLTQMALVRRKPRRGDEAEDTARVRRLAMAALSSSRLADEETIAAAATDPDGQVRRLALTALAVAAPGSVAEAARIRVLSAGLADPDYLVRYEALRIHGRTLTAESRDWAPVFEALSDPSPHVALLAIDLLGNPKTHPESAVERLVREADSLSGEKQHALGDPAAGNAAEGAAGWHRGAHALRSLARIAPDEARACLPRFSGSSLWPVRMYAARAAALLGDSDHLTRLAHDERDNVRDAAVAGLKTVAGHDADDLYLEALGRPDYQLVMTAALALEGTDRRAEAVPALVASLARITAEKRETSRDARLALIARVGELGQPADAPALLPYVSDFDPRVAAEAAAVIGKLTGRATSASPRPLPPIPLPELANIERLRGARAAVRISGRGAFEFTLLPDEAPATVARFVALARSGYYNGLTFHRVVPGFIVQGGSPGANEFVGDGPFMRDEIGLEPHVRGAASISTRGRDTGDAQIWFNLADNPRLDHDYTVFGRMAAGADVLDRILECDVIERIDILAK